MAMNLGLFYPSNIDNSDWLKYDAKVFEYAEIDCSFYRMPNLFTVLKWDVPAGFDGHTCNYVVVCYSCLVPQFLQNFELIFNFEPHS